MINISRKQVIRPPQLIEEIYKLQNIPTKDFFNKLSSLCDFWIKNKRFKYVFTQGSRAQVIKNGDETIYIDNFFIIHELTTWIDLTLETRVKVNDSSEKIVYNTVSVREVEYNYGTMEKPTFEPTNVAGNTMEQ